MSTRIFILALALSIGFIAEAEAAQTTAHKAQTIKSKQANRTAPARVAHAKRRSGRGAYFVPPPPAYMPSVLTELYVQRNATPQEEEELEEAAVAAKPKNPYSKYFYTADASAPKPVQARSGVSTWTATK